MLFATVVPAVVIGVLAYLVSARSETGHRTSADYFVLEYGKVLKALPAILGGLWTIAFAVVVIVEPPEASDIPTLLGVLALVTAMLVPLTLECRGVRHRVSSTGIEKISPWSPRFTLAWRDVRSVTWDPGLYGFVVTGPQGKVRLSRMLEGLTDFRRALAENVPAERWKEADPYLPMPEESDVGNRGSSVRPSSAAAGGGSVEKAGSRPMGPSWSVNGTGISTMGYRLQPDGTYLMTRWITVFLFPLVPLNSWIIRPSREVVGPGTESRREFVVVRRAPLEPSQVLRTYGRAVAVAVVAVGPVAIVFKAGIFDRLHQTNRDLSVAVVMIAVFWLAAVVFWVNRRVEMIYEIAERKAARGRTPR